MARRRILSKREWPPAAGERRAGLGGEALLSALAALGCLNLPVLRGGRRHEPFEQPTRGERDLLDGAIEGLCIGLRRLRRSAYLADILERGIVNLTLAGGR